MENNLIDRQIRAQVDTDRIIKMEKRLTELPSGLTFMNKARNEVINSFFDKYLIKRDKLNDEQKKIASVLIDQYRTWHLVKVEYSRRTLREKLYLKYVVPQVRYLQPLMLSRRMMADASVYLKDHSFFDQYQFKLSVELERQARASVIQSMKQHIR